MIPNVHKKLRTTYDEDFLRSWNEKSKSFTPETKDKSIL